MAGWPVPAAGVSAAGPATNAAASWKTTSSASSETNSTVPMRKEYQGPPKPGTRLSGRVYRDR